MKNQEKTKLKEGKTGEEKIKNSENFNNLEVEMVKRKNSKKKSSSRKRKTSTSPTYKKAKKAIKRLRSRY